MRLQRSSRRNSHRIFKAVSGAALQRFNTERQLRRLFFTGKNLAESLGMFYRLRNRLAIGYLRLADTGFHLKVLQHTGCQHI